MILGHNLATRITALLLLGFVAIQLLILATMTLPGRTGGRPSNLPAPSQLRTIAQTIEATPAERRPALVELFNGSLFTLRLLHATPARRHGDEAPDLRALRDAYAAALPGKPVTVDGRPGPLGRIIRSRPGPLRYLSPVRVVVGLADGEALVIDSKPSMLVRDYLRRRAFFALLGGLAILLALTLAVRQTTRPLVRMSEGVRQFSTTLDAPDLPIAGSREVRALSTAFNEMKERIGGLVTERTRILAAIAHDMRTYLTRLRLRAEFIADDEQRNRAAADLAEMSLLLDDTLLFAQTDAGARLVAAPIDAGAELAAIVALRHEMGEAVTFAGDVGEEARIRADPLALRRMLGNLIDNGLRHGTNVTLALRRLDETIEIIVADDGPGVPDAALAQLGEPYHRLDPSRDRASGGAGLGLAIVRALAAQAGATFTVANRAPRGLEARLRFERCRD